MIIDKSMKIDTLLNNKVCQKGGNKDRTSSDNLCDLVINEDVTKVIEKIKCKD